MNKTGEYTNTHNFSFKYKITSSVKQNDQVWIFRCEIRMFCVNGKVLKWTREISVLKTEYPDESFFEGAINTAISQRIEPAFDRITICEQPYLEDEDPIFGIKVI